MSLIYKGQTIADVGGSGGGGSSEEIYSTEETRIGTWFRKPLYRKGFVLNMPVSSGRHTLVDVSDLDIEDLIVARGDYKSTVSNSGIVERPIESNAFVFGLDSEKINLMVYATNDNGNVLGKISIEYTKTTDEATS